jgi:hypothetical protein
MRTIEELPSYANAASNALRYPQGVARELYTTPVGNGNNYLQSAEDSQKQISDETSGL